jgi:prevent-host-death family protein
MKIARVSELKASLSKYLARVKKGEEVIVTERGKPVAKLVPIDDTDVPDQARLRELVRGGLVQLPSGRLPSTFWRRERPADPGARLRAALLEEREAGR